MTPPPETVLLKGTAMEPDSDPGKDGMESLCAEASRKDSAGNSPVSAFFKSPGDDSPLPAKPPERNVSALSAVLDSLDSISSLLSVRLTFQQEQFIKFSSAVAFRGLLGDLMRLRDPQLEKELFKPDPDGSLRPPLSIRLIPNPTPGKADSVSFSLAMLSRDPATSARLLALIQNGFPGSPFGVSRIRSVAASCEKPAPCPETEAAPDSLFRVSLHFHTPVRIKRHGVIADPLSFSAAFVVSALLEKIASFSRSFGFPCSVPAHELVAAAALLPVRKRNIRYQTQQRVSGSSGQLIHLSGCVGSLVVDHCSADLVRLLQWGSRFGVGRHTSAGSGMYSVNVDRQE